MLTAICGLVIGLLKLTDNIYIHKNDNTVNYQYS
jgi:hypothetical protein